MFLDFFNYFFVLIICVFKFLNFKIIIYFFLPENEMIIVNIIYLTRLVVNNVHSRIKTHILLKKKVVPISDFR